MSSPAGSPPTSDGSSDEPEMQPISVKIHTSVVYSDAKIPICESEISLEHPISYFSFTQDIQMAIIRNDHNIRNNLAAARIVHELDLPLLIPKAMFFLRPSRDTISADISIEDDATLRQALENMGQRAWSDEIQMWLIKTDETAFGNPVLAPVDGESQMETPTNLGQSMAVEQIAVDEIVPDQGMPSDLSVTEVKCDKSDEKLVGSSEDMVIRGSLEDSRPFSV
jgi:hypothetical protein